MIFRGKSAVITGGTGGIGLATVRHLLKHGIEKIALLDIDFYEKMLIILREDFPKQEILFHLTDVTKKDDLERAFKEVNYKFHSIDIVITCAGVIDEQEYELTIDTNLLGVIHTNYAALPFMSKENGRSGGLIVNVSSVTGIDCSQFSSPVYNATKHAVVAFTRSMGDNFYLEKYGVKFITVCPGVTYTQFLDDLEEKMYSEEAYDRTSAKLEHVKTQTVDEFATSLIEVLETDKNGSVWLIDGGRSKEIEYQNPWLDNATI